MSTTALPPTVWQTRSPLKVTAGHITVDGVRKTLFGGTLDQWCRLYTCLTWNQTLKVNQLNPAGVALMAKELKSFRDAGGDMVRFLGDDAGMGCNAFCTGNGPMTSTMSIDPAYFLAMDNVLAICDQLGLRVCWVASFRRQILPADVPTWACPTFPEFTTQAYLNAPVGCNYPWRMWDAGARQFDYEYWGLIFGHVNSLTGVTYGQQTDIVIVQNEHSLCKDSPWAYNAHPIMNGLFNAAAAAEAAALGIPVAKLGVTGHNQLYIKTEAAVGTADAAVLRGLCPNALLCLTDYYGNGPYTMHQAGCQVGDVLSVHAYSYQSKSEEVANGGPGNGFLAGLTPTSGRSRYAAVLAGAAQPNAAGVTMSIISDETGVVAQFNTQRDPDAERSQCLAAMIQACTVQDVDVLLVYSWRHSGWMVNNVVQTGTADPYDEDCDAVFLTPNLKQLIAQFHDITQRGKAPVVTYTPPGGIIAGGSPYTDTGLAAIPAGTRVLISP
jgi:hypothetical protein